MSGEEPLPFRDRARDLLTAASKGDESAWRSLVAEFAPRLFGLLRARGAREELAEEITQSVFVTVAEQLPKYQESGRFESWIFQIAINRYRDELRRSGRHAQSMESEVIDEAGKKREGGGYRTVEEEDSKRLRLALESLSEADREVVELRHTAMLSFKQISEICGDPVGTLLARHHRALKKLREFLEPKEE